MGITVISNKIRSVNPLVVLHNLGEKQSVIRMVVCERLFGVCEFVCVCVCCVCVCVCVVCEIVWCVSLCVCMCVCTVHRVKTAV